jgi:uncharacterized protein
VDKDITKYKFIERLKSLSFIDEIWLFGSRARGDNTERSDIDLAIVCGKQPNFDWQKVIDIIDDADTLLKIDCVKFEEGRISDELKTSILKDKKVIYVKNKS